ncbi:DUF5677 domain-containing protein [Lactococcus lactis]|uniref:DUF5677 domain-containing protein n=1 Tax=Lactococcus lactis TaxID=1358 RepID=UPI00241709F5|nr:DUF5677 domain-containing protein [Lactococcus lactis]MDG4956755.1 DUF5677 domain-containing protein [Lactococcus lactis]
MNNQILDFKPIYELTKRRLRGLRKLAEKRSDFGRSEEMLLVLLGNMNQRLNTMFILLNNDISDGIYPLQRTFFEMQIAYIAMIKSKDKQKFVEFYQDKNSFETTNKINRFMVGDNTRAKKSFDSWEKEYVAIVREQSQKTLKESSKRSELKGNRLYKLWFELASGKSLQELAKEFGKGYEYFACFDEPSNWIHAQRIEMNINVETYEKFMNPAYFNLMLLALLQDIHFFQQAVADFAFYIKVDNSKQLGDYGEKYSKFLTDLRRIIDERYKSEFDPEAYEQFKTEIMTWTSENK